MAVKFDTKVLKVEVREKELKHPASKEAPAYYETVRIGKLTLEFDGDDVDVNQLAHFIGAGPSSVALASTQYQLPEGP